MDYYPQPRPVLYGTREDLTAAQTLTAPVRTGPPRFPPAPPLAGDAPDPFHGPRSLFVDYWQGRRIPFAVPLAILNGIALVYCLLQLVTGKSAFASTTASQIALVSEIVFWLLVVGFLLWPGGRAYLVALGSVLFLVSLGIVLGQWQSPMLWAAAVSLLCFLWPPTCIRYFRMAAKEVNNDLACYRCRHPRRAAHRSFKAVSGRRISLPDSWDLPRS